MPENSGNDSRYNRCNALQCLQKRYRPVGETILKIVKAVSMNLLLFNVHHIHQHHHWQRALVLSARRRRISTPRQFRDSQWTSDARRIWWNPSTDRQLLLLILKSSKRNVVQALRTTKCRSWWPLETCFSVAWMWPTSIILRKTLGVQIMEIRPKMITRIPPFRVTQGHWNPHGSIAFLWLPVGDT